MARGKAIVSSASEGPGQYLDGSTSRLFAVENVAALADELLYANTHRLHLQQLADHANEVYRQAYHADRVIPRIVACYEKAIDTHR